MFQLQQSTHVIPGWCDESDCKNTIKQVFEDFNYCLDPHTAIAYNVVKKLRYF